MTHARITGTFQDAFGLSPSVEQTQRIARARLKKSFFSYEALLFFADVVTTAFCFLLATWAKRWDLTWSGNTEYFAIILIFVEILSGCIFEIIAN